MSENWTPEELDQFWSKLQKMRIAICLGTFCLGVGHVLSGFIAAVFLLPNLIEDFKVEHLPILIIEIGGLLLVAVSAAGLRR